MLMCPTCGKNKANKHPLYGPVVCNECKNKNSYKGRIFKGDNAKFEELQTPFWKMIGAKPKPQELELDRYLKSRGMTYGDWRRERDYGASHPSAFPQFEAHMQKYGRNGAPSPAFGKDSQEPK